MKAFKVFIFICFWKCSKIEAIFEEDCEKPPEVEYSTVVVSTVDTEFVTAEYKCEIGFKLKGKPKITCELDLDEWLDEPPKCEPDDGEHFEGGKKRRKNKVHEIKEENVVTNEVAQLLDLSCLHKGLVKAPSIKNGFISKYNRRRKGEKIFLVAFYECNDDFEIENLDQDRLYCSKETWIGSNLDDQVLPKCLLINDDEDNEEGEDYSEGNDDVSGGESEVEESENDFKNQSILENSQQEGEPSFLINMTCVTDHGCEHECYMMKYDDDTHPIVQCKCFEGFYLDETDGRRCHDIDECSIDFGCEQICNNLLGSVECKCHNGLQVNHEDNKTCIDINECLENPCGPNSSCQNSYGTFTCIEDNLTSFENATLTEKNTLIKYEENSTEQSVVITIQQNASTHNNIESTTFPTTLESSIPTEINSNILVQTRSENEFVEENNNAEEVLKPDEGVQCSSESRLYKNTECEEAVETARLKPECQNIYGEGIECSCVEGYELSEDGKFCLDVDECEIYDDDSQENSGTTFCSHTCSNTIGGFICNCPDNFHIHDDLRSCIHDSCDDLETKCSHGCVDKNDGFLCTCPEGFSLREDYKTCVEESSVLETSEVEVDDNLKHLKVDCLSGFELMSSECVQDPCSSSECSHLCTTTTTTNKGYVCSCPEGLQLSDDQVNCETSDSCNDGNNGGCEQTCYYHYYNQSKVCSCLKGFEVDFRDDTRCQDVNECELNNEICGNLDCRNIVGSFECICHKGDEPDENGNCNDASPSCKNNGGCSHFCKIYSNSNEISCECPENMDLSSDKKSCVALDPCHQSTNICSHFCDSSLAPICYCPQNYKLDDDEHTCIDVDECLEENICFNGKCKNIENGYICECERGYETLDNHTCQDVDECLYENGNCSHKCLNYPGNRICSCPFGQILFEDDQTCGFSDLCEFNNGGCAHTCDFSENKIVCSCHRGYFLNSNDCRDINECLENNGGCQQICNNSEGSFECSCEKGFELDKNKHSCHDVDECIHENGNCTQICLNNLQGSYSCECERGFFLSDDNHTCQDVDECKGIHDCQQICENSDGSYDCSCHPGFSLSKHDKFNCHDVDECKQNIHECSQICTNTEGGYQCSCRQGYILTLDGKSCEALDLCNDGNNGGCEQTCHQTNQSTVRCSCFKGFQIDVRDTNRCQDINECETDNKYCQQQCNNLEGSFECSCFSGFRFNENKECVDIDECGLGSFRCPISARCINTAGSYECVCNDNFKLSRDKTECIEIKNECQSFVVHNGKSRCTRSRHKTQLFYRTKCVISCDKGYKLNGPSIRHCNGTGHWDSSLSTCVALECPKLKKPKVAGASILPSTCTDGSTFAGERCFLHCPPGYKPLGKRVAVCSQSDLEWLDLECIPVRAPLVKVQKDYLKHYSARPAIKCPSDVQIIKPQNLDKILVKIDKPTTNVNWDEFVDSVPESAKNLKISLPSGAHEITFRARSANGHFDICRFIIHIHEPSLPTVEFCPESFTVTLNQFETSRALFWKEAKFESKYPLSHISKSAKSGTNYGIGTHNVVYLASTVDGATAKCSFKITVKKHESFSSLETNAISGFEQSVKNGGLKNHDSFLLCPGKRAVKMNKEYTWHLPHGCIVKSYRRKNQINSEDLHKQHDSSIRHVLESENQRRNNKLKFYSAWNLPDTTKKQQTRLQESFPIAHWN